MPTFDKQKYRTDFDILNDPRQDDDLEVIYRRDRLRETADQLEGQLKQKNGSLFYRDVIFELAGRELGKMPKPTSATTEELV